MLPHLIFQLGSAESRFSTSKISLFYVCLTEPTLFFIFPSFQYAALWVISVHCERFVHRYCAKHGRVVATDRILIWSTGVSVDAEFRKFQIDRTLPMDKITAERTENGFSCGQHFVVEIYQRIL